MPGVVSAMMRANSHKGPIKRAAGPTVLLNKGAADCATIYLIPGVGGHVFPYKRMARHMPQDYRVIGLFFPFWVEGVAQTWSDRTIEDYALYLRDVIDRDRRALPSQPVRLFGYSLGGVLAWEVARLLREAGHDVHVVLFDAECPRMESHYGQIWWILRHIRKVFEYSAKSIFFGLTRNDYALAKTRLKHAVRRYRPPYLDANVVLMRPQQISAAMEYLYDRDMGWGSRCDDLQVVTTRGTHRNAYRDVNASSFARILTEGFAYLARSAR